MIRSDLLKKKHFRLAVFLLSGLCSGQDYEEDRLPIRSRNPRGPIVPSRAVKAQAVSIAR